MMVKNKLLKVLYKKRVVLMLWLIIIKTQTLRMANTITINEFTIAHIQNNKKSDLQVSFRVLLVLAGIGLK